MGLEDGEEMMLPLPAVVMARVEALRKNQEKHSDIESKYREERKALDAKYRAMYEPIYNTRADVVAGREKVEGEEEALKADKEGKEKEHPDGNSRMKPYENLPAISPRRHP
jgi:nucleosome assembly protein 1-like 1